MKSWTIHRASGALLLLVATLWSCSATEAPRRGPHVSLQDELACPPSCESIFKRLDRDGVQTTEIQIRGEVSAVSCELRLGILLYIFALHV